MRTASTSTRSLTGLSAAWTGILAAYGDWKDISQWPQVPGEDSAARRRLARQEDPTAKRGVIGAFCRTYSVTQAMERFIPGMYEETDIPGRYTYTGGSTAGGAIVYDEDRFLYSHHATDPCSGLLVNAFDLVRLHKYGDLDGDAKEGTPGQQAAILRGHEPPGAGGQTGIGSYVKGEPGTAQKAFQSPEAASEGHQDYDLSWLSQLTKDGTGRYEKTHSTMP